MKTVTMAVCRPGTGEKVDARGNPVEPGNEISVDRDVVGRDAGSAEIMKVDVVNEDMLKRFIDMFGGRQLVGNGDFDMDSHPMMGLGRVAKRMRRLKNGLGFNKPGTVGRPPMMPGEDFSI